MGRESNRTYTKTGNFTYIDWTQTINASSNSSTVVIDFYIGGNAGYNVQAGGWTVNVTINGTVRAVSFPYLNYMSGSYWNTKVGSVTVNIPHNADGTKSFGVSWSHTLYAGNSVNASYTVRLAPISVAPEYAVSVSTSPSTLNLTPGRDITFVLSGSLDPNYTYQPRMYSKSGSQTSDMIFSRADSMQIGNNTFRWGTADNDKLSSFFGEKAATGTIFVSLMRYPKSGGNPNTATISGKTVNWSRDVSTPDPVYSDAKHPTSVSLSKSSVSPGDSITISWSRGADGTNNPVTGYEIYRSINGGTSSRLQTINDKYTTSHTTTVPYSMTSSVLYSVFSLASNGVSGSVRSASATLYIPPNNRPNPPAVDFGVSLVPNSTTSIKLASITPGVDPDGQSTSVAYARTVAGTKSLATSSTSFPLNVGDNTFYFWSYDGSLYSANYVSLSVARAAAPTVTMAKSGTETDPSYNGTYTYAIGVRYTAKIPGGTPAGYVKLRIRKSSANAWAYVGVPLDSFSNTNADTTYSANINVLDYIGMGHEYQVVVVDSTNNLLASTSNIFYSGTPIAKPTVYNHATLNATDGTNPTHFYEVLRFNYTGPSGVQPNAQYSEDGVTWYALPGTPRTSGSQLTYTGIKSGPTKPGQEYRFRLSYVVNQVILTSEEVIMTRVPDFKFPALGFSSTNLAVVNNGSQNYEIRTSELTVDGLKTGYSIPSWSAINFAFSVSGSQRRLTHTMSTNTVNRIFNFTYGDIYPYDIANLVNSSTNNPFNLSFNEVYSANFIAEITDGFGRTYTYTLPSVDLNLKRTPTWRSSTNIARVRYSPSSSAVFSGQRVFEGERIELMFSPVVSRVGTQIIYRIYETSTTPTLVAEFRDSAVGPESTVTSINRELILPPETSDKVKKYRVEADDTVNAKLTRDFSSQVLQVGFTEGTFNIFRVNEGTTRTATVRVGSLGTLANITNIREAKLVIQASGDINFSTGVQSITVETATTTAAYQSLVTNVKEYSLASLPEIKSSIIYYRAILSVTPATVATTESYGSPKQSLSNTFGLYGETPSISYRKGHVGINGNQFGPKTAFLVSGSPNRNIVQFTSTSATVELNLETGEFDGADIDGGTW